MAAASDATRLPAEITDAEFMRFQRLFHQIAGVNLNETKRMLLVGRLSQRLRHYGLNSFSAYYALVADGGDMAERQRMVDLLTTHETFFFREPAHFSFLDTFASSRPGDGFRLWSAASSSGEEAYTAAMVLAQRYGLARNWEILGTDISTDMVARATRARYPIEEAGEIDMALLKKYALKGVRSQAGSFMFNAPLRAHVRFEPYNLVHPVRTLNTHFDVIFLRNVLIYFDMPTKQQVIAKMLPYLKPDGVLIVGHAESLHQVSDAVVTVRPTIYALRKHRSQHG